MNTALIACRIAACLGVDGDLRETALLALLHDAGLLAAGVAPEAEMDAIASEEALDPEGARLDAGSILSALAGDAMALAGLVRQTQVLLSEDGPPPGPRPDARAEEVALASLIDLHFHGTDSVRMADLHDVTSVVMESHGRRFSPSLFRALLRAIPIFPIGALVELSSGDLARVVSLNEDNHFRPRVEIAAVGGGEGLAERRVVDLSRAPFLHIRQRVTGAAPDSVGLPSAAGAHQ